MAIVVAMRSFFTGNTQIAVRSEIRTLTTAATVHVITIWRLAAEGEAEKERCNKKTLASHSKAAP